MPKRPPTHNENNKENEEELDIPELEDVVELPRSAEPAPPPNLDMFAGSEIDFDRLREELLDLLTGEIETVIAQVRADVEQTLRVRLDAQLRDRLPEIVDQVLRENGNGNGNGEQTD